MFVQVGHSSVSELETEFFHRSSVPSFTQSRVATRHSLFAMGRNRSPSPSRSSRRDRERSPGRQRSSRRTSPPLMDKHSSFTKSPKHRNSASRSPSPRTKRLRRAESDRVAEKKYEREHNRNGSGRSHDGGAHRERDSTKETDVERRDRRSEREETNGKSPRSRGERSESPQHRRSRHRSRSPAEGRAREEVSGDTTVFTILFF